MKPFLANPANAFRALRTNELARKEVQRQAREGLIPPTQVSLVDMAHAVEATIRYRYDIFDTSSASSDLTDVNIPLTDPPANLTSAIVNAWKRRKE